MAAKKDFSSQNSTKSWSSGTTVEDSFEAPAPNSVLGLFATLTPINSEACKAFNSAVDVISTHEAAFEHQASFIQFSQKQLPLTSLLESRGIPSEDSFSDTDSEDDKPKIDNHAAPDLVYEGKFRLTFKNYPASAKVGWVLGKGRFSKSGPTTDDVDLLLGWNTDKVHGRHATIQYDPETGILHLQALHTKSVVILDERPFTKAQGPLALNGISHTIRMGHLAYRFEFVQYSGAEFKLMEEAKMQFHYAVLHAKEDPIRQTFPTPAVNDMTVGSWVLHNPMGAGAVGIVSAASRKDGPFEVVAIKDLVRRNYGTRHIAQREAERARLVAEATSTHKWRDHLSVLRDVLCTNANPSDEVPDHIFLLFNPLCRGDLSTHVLNDKLPRPTPEMAVELFTQILRGMTALHESGIVHRDIKPPNIGVQRLIPPHVVLLDYGNVNLLGDRTLKPKPGTCGTVSYIAPETEVTNYGYPVDIWAAGLVGFQLFFGYHPLKPLNGKSLWRRDNNTSDELAENKRSHSSLIEMLGTASYAPAGDLLQKLLAFEPKERLKASEALQHPALQKKEVEVKKESKAKRGTKRVRDAEPTRVNLPRKAKEEARKAKEAKNAEAVLRKPLTKMMMKVKKP
ncbi:putative serine threonine protein [Diplodia seriata]|uniref:non-specific serine/threonine protein kinase n=1 Tax=Diplodia seriata TaxID=420778 RepID=A0A0G2GGU3_9PEZI|nr:putative serine threonine protein [Diplodia seriata]